MESKLPKPKRSFYQNSTESPENDTYENEERLKQKAAEKRKSFLWQNTKTDQVGSKKLKKENKKNIKPLIEPKEREEEPTENIINDNDMNEQKLNDSTIINTDNPDLNDIIKTMNFGMKRLADIMFNGFNQIVEHNIDNSQDTPRLPNAQSKFQILSQNEMLSPANEETWFTGEQIIPFTQLSQMKNTHETIEKIVLNNDLIKDKNNVLNY